MENTNIYEESSKIIDEDDDNKIIQGQPNKTIQDCFKLVSDNFPNEISTAMKRQSTKILDDDNDFNPVYHDTENEDNFSCDSEMSLEEIEDAEKFDDTLLPKGKKPKKLPKNVKPKKIRTKKKDNIDPKLRYIKKVIKSGNLPRFKKILDKHMESIQTTDRKAKRNSFSDFLNQVIDDKGNTLLHIASREGQLQFVQFMITNGADMCAKNKNAEAPYSLAKTQEVRDWFIRVILPWNTLIRKEAQIPINAVPSYEKKDERYIKKEKKRERKEKIKHHLEKKRTVEIGKRRC